MSLEELSGLPPDPDCLHCTLAPAVNAALKHKSIAQVTGEILQIVAELLASTSERNRERMLADACTQLVRMTCEAEAKGLRAAGKIR